MKRSMIGIACLVLAPLGVAACSASAQGGKTELAAVCQERMKGSSEACGCYVNAIEAALPADTFTKVTAGAKMNRQYRSAEILPANLTADPAVRQAMTEASNTCLRSA
jgi:hypothetical protein